MMTDCIFPPELNDKKLLQYLDGITDNETMFHLERCPHCRQKADAMARLQTRLTVRLSRVTCPPPEELGEYHLHMLPAPQMLIVGAHLRECPHCTREVAELEEFLGEKLPMSEISLAEKAQILIARLVGGGAGVGMPSVIASPALRGERQGPITLEADGAVIVLDMQPSTDGGISILGQVAADDQDFWTESLVELRQSDQLESTTTVDDLGGFRCENIRPGPKELRLISKAGSVVVVSNFEVPD